MAAGGPFEGAGGGGQLGAGGGRGGLGDRVQEFADADELGGGFLLVTLAVEEDGGTLGGAGGAAPLPGGRGPLRPAFCGRRRCLVGGAVGQAVPDLREGEVGASLEPGYQTGSPWRLRSPGRATL